ncbi:MAG: hypothetical protein ABR616_13700, partial [Dermatophilaceae bacterium]
TVEFWKQKAREQEKRAKDNATAAKRLAEIEEQSKSAEEKAAERLAAAERRATEIEARANRAEIAATTGVPVEILAGPKDTSPEAVAEFAATVKAHFERTDTQRKQHNNIAPREGTTPQAGTDDMREFTRNLFASAD